MPDMTGLELIQQLRAMPIRQPIRTILITAHHSAELVALSRQVKVDDYLVKPVYPKQIRGLVQSTYAFAPGVFIRVSVQLAKGHGV